jgi:S-adenosylmethionine-diacylglycerol 3-amino-3-carboxypropyl transferase
MISKMNTQSPLFEKWDLEELRYSFVWEDVSLLLKSIGEIPGPLGKTLSIGSSGDNAFGLLLAQPKELVILDLSPSQIALVEIKRAAIQSLSYEEFMTLFAESPGEKATALYGKLRSSLRNDFQKYWDSKLASLKSGLHDQGRLDKYFKKFRTQGLPAIWNSEDFADLVSATDLKTQLSFWKKADLAKLKNLAGEFFSQGALSSEGRHGSQFEYVKQENLGQIFLRNFVRLIQTELISENPYLTYFLTGRALRGPASIPLWNKENFEVIKSRIGCVEIKTQDLESYLATVKEPFDFMNLSDLFEYVSDEHAQALFKNLGSHLSLRGKLAYWTLLVPRFPKDQELAIDEKESRELSLKDRTWFYSGFHVARKNRD